VLNNGWRIKKDFQHYEHGYAMTSHSAQGKTVDWVFVAQSAQLSQCASDANQFYVSISRGSEGIKLYTESLELLLENVSRRRERPMATEILYGKTEEEAKTPAIEKTSNHLGQTPEYTPPQPVYHEKASPELGMYHVSPSRFEAPEEAVKKDKKVKIVMTMGM
jgi:hypothetical protein